MNEGESGRPPPGASVREQLERAVRDLWSMLVESGDDYVVFIDHRRMNARVRQNDRGGYEVSWETDEGNWLLYHGEFSNPREAAFHAFQGPH